MDDVRFEWDPAKSATNLRKHGVLFEEAQTAFVDDYALVVDDPEHSADEARFILLGLSASLRMLVVVHVLRTDRGAIRLISARQATRSERATYFERLRR
jgi:uncharacterized DUF497 family protein